MADWMKTFKSGLAAGVVMLAASLVLMPVWNAVFPGLQAEYYNAMFRPWSDPRMSYIFVHPFVLGLAMAYAYDYFGKSFKGRDYLRQGAAYGFVVFVLASIPGMLMTYSSFSVSAEMVLSWTLNGLVQLLAGGAALAWAWNRNQRVNN